MAMRWRRLVCLMVYTSIVGRSEAIASNRGVLSSTLLSCPFPFLFRCHDKRVMISEGGKSGSADMFVRTQRYKRHKHSKTPCIPIPRSSPATPIA